MKKIKIGDIVARKSHNEDILFSVEKILINFYGKQVAILKGIIVRIVVEAYLEDLILIDTEQVDDSLRSLDAKIENRINSIFKQSEKKGKERNKYVNINNIKTGKILHLDGDRVYSEKSERYYRKIGLNAVVINVPENKQHLLVREYINKYNPDILVLTGHDRNDKNRNPIWRVI